MLFKELFIVIKFEIVNVDNNFVLIILGDFYKMVMIVD